MSLLSLTGHCPPHSRRSLHDLEPLRHHLRDLLVLVLQLAQRERDVVPLLLAFRPR